MLYGPICSVCQVSVWVHRQPEGGILSTETLQLSALAWNAVEPNGLKVMEL